MAAASSQETFTNQLHGGGKDGAGRDGSSSSSNKARGGGGGGDDDESGRRLLAAGTAQTSAAAARSSSRANNKKPPFMIMPDSPFHLTWIQVRVVVALYIVWVTPVRVGFSLPADGAWFWLEAAIDLFFAADVALNFFTAYEDPATGELVASRASVARRYLRGWFTVDLLASLPVELAVRAAERSWLCSVRADCLWGLATESALASAARGLRGLRVFRVAWIVKRLRHMRASHLLGALADDLYLAVAPFLSIAELLVVLLYLGHACGCFFYMLSTPRWQTPHERALVASGLMETWTRRTFGGERLVMPPLPCGGGGNGGSSSSLAPSAASGGPAGGGSKAAWLAASGGWAPPATTVLHGTTLAASFVLAPSSPSPSSPASWPPLPPPLHCLEIAGLISPPENGAPFGSSNNNNSNSSNGNSSTPPFPPPPALLLPPAAAAPAPFPLIALDAASGQWHACPREGYSLVPCPPCSSSPSSSAPSSLLLQTNPRSVGAAALALAPSPAPSRCCRDGPPFRCRTLYRLPYRYVTSVYWAYTTMTTVGYGDIAAVTAAEKLWAITTMIIAGFFFSFVVGRVASAVSKLDAHRAAAEERLEAARCLARDASLPRALSKRVLDHLKKQQVRPYDRDRVLRSLPFALRAPVLRHLYGRAVEGVPLLARLAREYGQGGGGGGFGGAAAGGRGGGGREEGTRVARGGRGRGGGAGGAVGAAAAGAGATAEADSDAELFLADVCSRLQPYNVAARSHVYQRGEAGGDLFMLLRGELHVVAERAVAAAAAAAAARGAAAAEDGGGDDDERAAHNHPRRQPSPQPPPPPTTAAVCLRLRIPEGSIFGEGAALKAFEAAGGGALANAAAAGAATTAPAAAASAARPRREEAVYATTPASLLRIGQEDAVDLLAQHPRLAEALSRLQRARAAEVDALARDERDARAEAAVAAAAARAEAEGAAAATAGGARGAAESTGGAQLLRELLRRMAPPRGLLASAGAAAAAADHPPYAPPPPTPPPRLGGGGGAPFSPATTTWGGGASTRASGAWATTTTQGARGAGAGGGGEREPLLLVDASDSTAASSLSFTGVGGSFGGGGAGSSFGGGSFWVRGEGAGNTQAGRWGGPVVASTAATAAAAAPAALAPRASSTAADDGGAFGSTCLALSADRPLDTLRSARATTTTEGVPGNADAADAAAALPAAADGPPEPAAAAASAAAAAAASAAASAAAAAAGEAMAAVRAMTEEMARLRAALEAGPQGGGGGPVL